MKNIIYISDYHEIGGGESSLLNLMRQIKKNKKFNPILLTPKYGELNKIAEKYGIETHSFKYSNLKRAWIKDIPLFSLKGTLKLGKLLKEREIKLIHVNNNGFALVNSLLISKLKKIPLIWTCHGKWEKPYGFRAKILNLFLKKVFCVSEYVKKDVKLSKKKIKKVYLGINFDEIKNGNRDLIRKELGLETKDVLIGMIGRYQDVKRQDLFVEAAYELRKKNKNLKFLMVGDAIFSGKNNEFKEKVLNLLKKYKLENTVYTMSQRRDIENVYAALDLLVVPSDFETFSMVTLEGIANGLNVVVTNIGGPKEIIGTKFGRTFKSGDLENLVLTIEKAFNKPITKETLFERAKDFDILKITKKIEREYMEVLN